MYLSTSYFQLHSKGVESENDDKNYWKALTPVQFYAITFKLQKSVWINSGN